MEFVSFSTVVVFLPAGYICGIIGYYTEFDEIIDEIVIYFIELARSGPGKLNLIS